MAKIIISYRRADSQAMTGRICDRLVSHYGQHSVFIDVDSIPFGIDFRDYIKQALAETDIVLAVIGKQWLGASAAGPARIMDETDPVRIEVETALARNIAVIPVLLDDATMPTPDQLPEGLRNLCYRNAAQVDSGPDFHLHMDRLIRSMDRLLERMQQGAAAAPPADPRPQPTADAVAAGAAAARAAPGPAPTMYPSAWAQAAPAPPPQVTGMAAPKSGGAWIKGVAIAASVLVLLLASGLGALLFFRSGDTTRTAQAPAAVPTPPPAPAPVRAPATPPATPPAAPAPVPIYVPSPPPPKCLGSTNAVFEDNFNPPAVGWDDPSATRVFEDGQLVIRSGVNLSQTWLYRPIRLKTGSVCAVLKAPAQVLKTDGKASAGLVFWATDYQNYYLASVYLDGTYQIYRRFGGEWIAVTPRAKSEHVKAGPGASNTLQVSIKGTNGTFYANGQMLVEFRGQPPKIDGGLGLSGQSEAERDSDWHFVGMTIVDDDAKPPKPASPKAMRLASTPSSCKGDPDAAFADDFKKVDLGWGETSETVFYEGGHMVLRPSLNRYRVLLYRSLLYVNPTVCVNLLWPIEAESSAGAGVVFWATDYLNYYQAKIFRDGTFDVHRYFHEEWLTIRRRVETPAIRKELGASNQIKVVLVNNRATLLINDVKVLEFFGQQPPNGGAVGMIALGEKEQARSWRFTDIVVVD